MVDDFRGGPEGGYSPHIAPSQKHVMDDMGEISLDSGIRSEFANSDKGSSEAERQRHASSASTIPSTGAVMVTTTIKRESKPEPALFEEMQIEDGYTAPPSNASSRPMSGRDQEFDNYTRGSRTKITAGKR